MGYSFCVLKKCAARFYATWRCGEISKMCKTFAFWQNPVTNYGSNPIFRGVANDTVMPQRSDAAHLIDNPRPPPVTLWPRRAVKRCRYASESLALRRGYCPDGEVAGM